MDHVRLDVDSPIPDGYVAFRFAKAAHLGNRIEVVNWNLRIAIKDGTTEQFDNWLNESNKATVKMRTTLFAVGPDVPFPYFD